MPLGTVAPLSDVTVGGLTLGLKLKRTRLIPEMIRQFANLLADARAQSLLDRPVDDGVDLAIATGRAGSGSRTVGQLRYAHRKLTDLVAGADADSEFARDTWRAKVLGIHVLKGAQQIRFGNVAQAWLREPVKRYARFRLATGKGVRVGRDRRPVGALVIAVPRRTASRRPRTRRPEQSRARALPVLVRRSGHGGPHDQQAAGVPARLPGNLPSLWLDAGSAGHNRDLSRRAPAATTAAAQVRPRVRDGPDRPS